jgi:hypothetical protein
VDVTDWTTTKGCARCDVHGPFLPSVSSGEAARDVHQAWHGMVAEFLAALRIPQAVEWLSRHFA